MLKVEMHSHTRFSHDGFITPRTFTRCCRNRHIDCVCITDHETMQGAITFAQQVPVRIIAGQEIPTEQGDVIGLFLTEEIPSALSMEEAVCRIKAQVGIEF